MRGPFRIKSRKAWYIRLRKQDGSGGLTLKKIGLTQRQALTEYERIKRESPHLLGDQNANDNLAGEAFDGTVLDLVSKYCEWMQYRVSQGLLAPASETRRLAYLASFLVSVSETLTVDQIGPAHIERWLKSMAPRWNLNTQFYAGTALKRVMNWAVKRDYIVKSPLLALELTKGGSREYVVSNEVLSQLRTGASDPRFRRNHVIAFRLILTVLSLSGCRPGELCNVMIEEMHLDRWIIHNHKNARKTKKPRIVWLCPCLSTISRIVLHKRKSGPLFLANFGEPWTYSKMRRRFERLRKRVGVDPKCVLYSFRHTSITNALVAGIDVARVAELHGTSIQMIESHYGHLCQHRKHMQQAALTLAKARY